MKSMQDSSSDEIIDALIAGRDKAEEFASHIYFLVFGHSPEWSNHFGYDEATEEIKDAIEALKGAAREWQRFESEKGTYQPTPTITEVNQCTQSL